MIAQGGASGSVGDLYYGYHDDLYAEVSDSFARLGVPLTDNRVDLVKGLFEDTLGLDGPVAFAHIDGDWYDSAMVCLTRIAPRLSVRRPPGRRRLLRLVGVPPAVDDYFRGRDEFRLLERAKLHVVLA